MRTDVWVHAVVIGLAVAQFLIFWYLYRRSGMSSTHEAGQSGVTSATEGNTTESSAGMETHHVACPNCGARNAARFRYCQNCVEELPRGAESG